jgi:hypothetical protein
MSNKVLKAYMKQHFDFSSLKKVGFYPKEMKHTDYEGQAKRVCHFFGLESIYDYNKYEIRCHISYAEERPTWVDESGKIKTIPFVEISNENPMHISESNQ